MFSSTNSVVKNTESLQAVFKTDLSLTDIFTGRFEQLLLVTNHYKVKLVTYIGNETEGEPINGVEYVVEVADERVFKRDTAKEVEAVIEALYIK